MPYTNIDDPSAHFQALTYTGNGSNPRNLTNDGNSDLKPDLIWGKSRGTNIDHQLYDSSRGFGTGKGLQSNSSAAESGQTTYGYISTALTDGFTAAAGATNGDWFNRNNDPFVAWQWKANGGTTSSNTDGSITSTVQANQDAGFSIVTYTGTGTAATIGHGLGVTPDIIIFKRRDGTNNWDFQYKGELRLTLNLTDAQATNVLCTFTSTTTDLGSVATGEKNANGGTYVAYCFAEKQGYSKFGSYVGNGSADGPFIYTGFKPAWIMVKDTESSGDNWQILDTKRDPHNPQLKYLQADNAGAEGSFTFVDILSNGFKFRSTYSVGPNVNGHKTIYMAFAENPFVTSTGIPTTAR